MELFKFTAEDGSAIHGGSGKWHLPTNGKPGKWMPKITGELIPCQRGYHLCRVEDVLDWNGAALWRAEYRGQLVEDTNKVVVSQARLVSRVSMSDRALRLFACDCAERVVHLTGPHPESVKAIEVSRLFAIGEASAKELAAARDTAWDAVRAAARDAARAAAWAAAWAADRDTAWNAVRAAARDAARAAAWAAAWAADRDAAWNAVRDAAWAADRDAAWNAVRDAERKWQIARFNQYLTGEV